MSSEAKLCKFRHLGPFFEPREANPENEEDQAFYWKKGISSFLEFFKHLNSLQNVVTEDDFRKALAKRRRKVTENSQWSRNQSITTQPSNYSHDPEVGEQAPLMGDSAQKSEKGDADMEPPAGCWPYWPCKCSNTSV